MSHVKVYQYKACGTCQKALKWLKTNGVAYEEIAIVDQPPTVDVLKAVLSKSGVDLRKLFNTSGVVYKEQNLKEKLPLLSDEEMLQMLAGNGKLIKRPIVISEEKATVGFHEPTFEGAWGKSK
jgi:arsenate reductase